MIRLQHDAALSVDTPTLVGRLTKFGIGVEAGMLGRQSARQRSSRLLWNRTQSQHNATAFPANLALQHVSGHAAVLAHRPALKELATRSGQIDSAEDLAYFLEKPGLMRRTPHLLLLRKPAQSNESTHAPTAHASKTDASSDLQSNAAPGLCGALLVNEYRPLGYATRAFAASDRSGRGVLLAAPEDRLQLALEAGSRLFQAGAKIVLLTIQCGASEQETAAALGHIPGAQWAVRTRTQATHLQLASSFDATLASLGQKTRSNLRYYRRRAETELHCRFVPDVKLTLPEFVEFNRCSTFPLPERTLKWRLGVQRALKQPYLMGLQDGDGRWLSLIGGRRFGASTEILWQMNRTGLQRHSIVSAMRSYHMEHEIGLGARELYIEGGTPHSMQNSFQSEPITDIIFVRTRLKRSVSAFARRYIPTDNLLAEMLFDPATQWHGK